MADTAPAVEAPAAASNRPQKPDEAKFKEDLAKAEKTHDAAQKKFQEAKTKFDNAKPGKGGPVNERWTELVEDNKAIRAKQQEHKGSKQGQQEKLSRNDAALKKLFEEQKQAKARLPYKSLEELESKVAALDKQVGSGQMKIVDEKKALEEMTKLNRSKKSFGFLTDIQKQIDQTKAENAELKKTFDNPESRALSQKYEENQKELDEIKAGREQSRNNLDSLKADRERLYNEQQKTWEGIKLVKDEYYQGRKAHKEYEDTLYQQRREKKAAEDAAWRKSKRQGDAQKKLEEASDPAFSQQITVAEGLIRFFDPSYGTSDDNKAPGEFAASAGRTVDESGFKGMKVVKKEEESFFIGSGGKKGKKGKKGGPAESGKFNLNIGVIEELGQIGVDPPSTQADVPGVVEKLKAKLDEWKKNQNEQTEKNIAKAKAEIERLEKEAEEAPPSDAPRKGRQERSKKVAQKNAGANADIPAENEVAQEKEAVADVTKDLKEAKIEDTNGEATA